MSATKSGWAELRKRIAILEKGIELEPHVTLVHPRTSNRGPTAWSVLQGRSFEAELQIRSVCITAFDGRCWPTVQTVELG
jgi:hypothetical protein